MVRLSRLFCYPLEYHIMVHTPSCKQDGLGCSAFARHYLRNHYCFLFLRLLRCFTSPSVALMHYFIHTPITGYDPCWVFPFGNLRIKGYLPLPEAYRSLSRPSSPTDAKAFTVRPQQLDQIKVTKRISNIYIKYTCACCSYSILCNCQRTVH